MHYQSFNIKLFKNSYDVFFPLKPSLYSTASQKNHLIKTVLLSTRLRNKKINFQLPYTIFNILGFTGGEHPKDVFIQTKKTLTLCLLVSSADVTFANSLDPD